MAVLASPPETRGTSLTECWSRFLRILQSLAFPGASDSGIPGCTHRGDEPAAQGLGDERDRAGQIGGPQGSRAALPPFRESSSAGPINSAGRLQPIEGLVGPGATERANAGALSSIAGWSPLRPARHSAEP